MQPAPDKGAQTAASARKDAAAEVQHAVVQTMEPVSAPRFVPPSRNDVDILKLLTNLEEMVENTHRLPLGIFFGFPEEAFLTTLLKIRANLPEEMRLAARMAQEQTRLLEETKTECARLKEETRTSAQQSLETGRTQAQTLARQHLEEAQKQAEQILQDAREKAKTLVAESEIVQQALLVARETTRRAEEEAHETTRGADQYALTVLTNLEDVLQKATGQIQRGRALLSQDQKTAR